MHRHGEKSKTDGQTQTASSCGPAKQKVYRSVLGELVKVVVLLPTWIDTCWIRIRQNRLIYVITNRSESDKRMIYNYFVSPPMHVLWLRKWVVLKCWCGRDPMKWWSKIAQLVDVVPLVFFSCHRAHQIRVCSGFFVPSHFCVVAAACPNALGGICFRTRYGQTKKSEMTIVSWLKMNHFC